MKKKGDKLREESGGGECMEEEGSRGEGAGRGRGVTRRRPRVCRRDPR